MRPSPPSPPATSSACWRRSIRSCGTATASSCCGAGRIASRRIHRQSKRKLGYYALPMLWRDRVVGWANVSNSGDELNAECRYVQSRRPRDRGFSAALDAELERMRVFLTAR